MQKLHIANSDKQPFLTYYWCDALRSHASGDSMVEIMNIAAPRAALAVTPLWIARRR